MRHHLAFAVSSIFGMLLTGCIPTLHPVYTKDDLVFDKALIGVWQPSDGSSTWEFGRGSGKSYKFIFTDKDGEASEFEAHVARFAGLTYLGLQPTKKGITGNSLYKAYLLRLHTFLRVDEVGPDTLRLSSIDGNWLKKQLSDNPRVLDHERLAGGILLTASSKELQTFLSKHKDTPSAFSQVSTLHRRKK